MPLWGMVDNAANSVISAVQQINKTVSTTNRNNLYSNVTANVLVSRTTVGMFGVSAGEMSAMQASGNAAPAHAGWGLRTVGQGGRAGRVMWETLVAAGSMTGDNEDTVTPDYYLVIDTQPQSSNLAPSNAVNLIVSARSIPAGATIEYQWQRNTGSGWSNVANVGTFASANGNTTSTLSIANNTIANANTFRVILSTSGTLSANLVSANASVLNLGV